MATFVSTMNLSLDGYVDHVAMRPDPVVFRHWLDHLATITASIYGRKMYEIMRYWDEDHAEWDDDRRAFAVAWRRLPKFVVSRTLDAVGPNATLIRDDVDGKLREMKTRLTGDVTISGTVLSQHVATLGLIDEYRLYYRPVALGRGTPFFAGPREPMRLVSMERIGSNTAKLVYVPE